MTPRDILIAARAKIETPETWTQDVYARDALGEEIDPRAYDATCWCSVGAVRCVGYRSHVGINDARVAIQLLADVMGERIAPFNDYHSHGEVLEMFDLAIAKAEAP